MPTVDTSDGGNVSSRNSRDRTVPFSECKYHSGEHFEFQETVLPIAATGLVHLYKWKGIQKCQ